MENEDTEQPWWREMPSDRTREQTTGSAAQEMVRLAASVAEWASRSGLSETFRTIAEQTAGSVRSAASAATTSTSPASPADSEEADLDEASSSAPEHLEVNCDYCPVCQGMSMLRAVSPEAATGMVDALSAVTEVVKQAIDGLVPPQSPSSRVEHIDIE
jgi:hypothetical protein